jgi:hypothetical protein
MQLKLSLTLKVHKQLHINVIQTIISFTHGGIVISLISTAEISKGNIQYPSKHKY